MASLTKTVPILSVGAISKRYVLHVTLFNALLELLEFKENFSKSSNFQATSAKASHPLFFNHTLGTKVHKHLTGTQENSARLFCIVKDHFGKDAL